MTQLHAPANLVVVRFRRETTFGSNSGGTLHRIHPLEGFSKKLAETQINVKELQSRLTQHSKNLRGPRRGTVNIPLMMRAAATQLDAGASAPSDPSPNGAVMRAALGGWNANRGSTVQASSTTTLLKVATGHGTRFPVGSFGAVEVAGELEVFAVSGVTGDDVSIYPALSASPTTGGKIVGGHHFYWANVSRESASIEVANASEVSGMEDDQYEFLGAQATSFALETKLESEVTFTVGFESAGGNGPSALSQSLTDEADTQSDGFVYMDAVLWLAQQTTADRSHVTHHSFALKANTGMVPIKDGGGVAKSNRAGTVRTGKLEASIEIEVPLDVTFQAEYTSKTDYEIVLIFKIGTGTSARFCVVSAPCAYLEELPDEGNESNRVTTPLKFSLRENNGGSWPASDDKSRSPFSIYLL